jgi:hypothetical protein
LYPLSALFFDAAPFILTIRMELPDLYGDWRIIAGVVLILLGTGNWLVGLNGIVQYRRLVVATPYSNNELYRNFDELDARTDGAVLAPLNQEERTVSYAAAQMDFYHAVYLTGCFLFALGLMVAVMAFIGAIRRDAREALRARFPGDAPTSYEPAFRTVDARQDQPLSAYRRTPS